MNVFFIFEVQEVNGALFLKANFLSYRTLFGLVKVIFSLQFFFIFNFFYITTYVSEQSHKSDLSIDVLNFICLFGLYLSSALPD